MRFTEILDNYGVPYLTEGHHHCRPGWVQFDCPFCGRGSGKFHMGYSLAQNYAACWRCRGHSLIRTLTEVTGEREGVIKRLIRDIDGRELEKLKDERGTLTLPSSIVPLKKVHANYLRSRRYEPRELVRLWGIQGLDGVARVKTPAGKRIHLAWRIFIPIAYRGDIVSWTTRAIRDEVSQRYISAPADCEAINHKDLLYGEEHARHAVCCVEGPFDAWRIGPGAVASCGTGFSRSQVYKLSKYTVRGICFDNEPDAQKRAKELVDMLAVFPGETYNIVLDAKDPGEASDREVARIRKALSL